MGKRGGGVRGGRGRWQVERERHQLDQSKPWSSFSDACPIGETMPRVMGALGLREQHWLATLPAEWAQIVGEAVAGHTRPGTFQNRELTVFVDNSVWLNELSRYGRKEMLAKLQLRFGVGKVKSVGLKIDPDGHG